MVQASLLGFRHGSTRIMRARIQPLCFQAQSPPIFSTHLHHVTLSFGGNDSSLPVAQRESSMHLGAPLVSKASHDPASRSR